MRIDEITVSTAQAAELTGWGYETFRARLKEGMLKATGTLPKLQGKDTPAVEADAKRWSWSRFGLRDLCSFRLIRCLMDSGLSFDEANEIGSDEALWRHWRGADDHAAIEKWTPVFVVCGRTPNGALDWTIYNTAGQSGRAAAYAAAEGRKRTASRAKQTAEPAGFVGFWGESDHAITFVPVHLIRWRIGQALIEIAGDEYGA